MVVEASGEGGDATGMEGKRNDNSAGDAGAAYVFVRNGTSWSQLGYLKASNTGTDDRFGGAESIIMMEIHSAMCAPLLRDGKVSGYIYVDRQSGTHPFDMSQLQALSILALLSAIAVEQAALRDDIRREQERRNRLARYSSTAVVQRML